MKTKAPPKRDYSKIKQKHQVEHCHAKGCTRFTREGKRHCPDHVDHEERAKFIARALEARSMEVRAVAAGKRDVELGCLLLLDVLNVLRGEDGYATVKRLVLLLDPELQPLEDEATIRNCSRSEWQMPVAFDELGHRKQVAIATVTKSLIEGGKRLKRAVVRLYANALVDMGVARWGELGGRRTLILTSRGEVAE